MGTLSLLVVPALVLLAAATAARGAAREGDGLLATRSGEFIHVSLWARLVRPM